jgi:hypothetical protein
MKKLPGKNDLEKIPLRGEPLFWRWDWLKKPESQAGAEAQTRKKRSGKSAS